MRVSQPINAKDGKCWCPICDRTCQLVAAVGIWVHEDHQVCLYGICNSCLQKGLKQTDDEKLLTMNQVEAKLLKRYPQLQLKLMYEGAHARS